MIFDPKTRQIFILGRYLERGLRDRAQNIKVLSIMANLIDLLYRNMYTCTSEHMISSKICLKSEFLKVCLKINVVSSG